MRARSAKLSRDLSILACSSASRVSEEALAKLLRWGYPAHDAPQEAPYQSREIRV